MNELLPSIAEQIRQHHEAAQELADQTRESANAALCHAVQAGMFIEQVQGITKGQTLAWLRDNVPGVTPQRAKAYLSLFHTAEVRRESIVDHRQLILLGVIDQKEGNGTPKPPSIGVGKWVRWSMQISTELRSMVAERPINEWPIEEREAVTGRLKPIVELYRALGGQVP